MKSRDLKRNTILALVLSACVPNWDKVEDLQMGGAFQEGMEPGDCMDGADNDGDGDFDCRDSDCQSGPDCNENFAAGDCSDNEDNDSDGAVDCSDEDCVGADDCLDENELDPEDPQDGSGYNPEEDSEEGSEGNQEEDPDEGPGGGPGGLEEPSFEGGDPQHGLEIELTWSLLGDDLDLHVIAPDLDWEDAWMTDDDCHYANCAAYSGEQLDWGVEGVGADDPVLMMDDIEGDGPELTVFEEPETTGTYSVVVHDYQTSGTDQPNTVMLKLYSYGSVFWSIEKELPGDNSCLLVAYIDMANGIAEDADAEPVDCPNSGGGNGGGPGGGNGGGPGGGY
ncbi:MAG: hypothetical protein CMK59_05620 [Proteobacteria bacterium]|nr:hypothetical protein [Pseudomonadota bacterium]